MTWTMVVVLWSTRIQTSFVFHVYLLVAGGWGDHFIFLHKTSACAVYLCLYNQLNHNRIDLNVSLPKSLKVFESYNA